MAANAQAFRVDDIQHKHGCAAAAVRGSRSSGAPQMPDRRPDPYGASKRAIDILNGPLNDRLVKVGAQSFVACPGLFLSSMTYNILPFWLWMLLFPVMLLVRACVPGRRPCVCSVR